MNYSFVQVSCNISSPKASLVQLVAGEDRIARNHVCNLEPLDQLPAGLELRSVKREEEKEKNNRAVMCRIVTSTVITSVYTNHSH